MRQYVVLLIIILSSCNGNDQVFTPKPHMFPRVDYPVKNYISFNQSVCSFTFEYPDYAEYVASTNFFDEKPSNPCWFDLNIPKLNSQIHFSYFEVGELKSFDKLVDDAFKMADKHNVKAFFREESEIIKPGVSGLVFEIKGPVASPIQFYVTDSTSHFLRASLYFNDRVNADSLAPIVAFVKKDIDHLISTFEWK